MVKCLKRVLNVKDFLINCIEIAKISIIISGASKIRGAVINVDKGSWFNNKLQAGSILSQKISQDAKTPGTRDTGIGQWSNKWEEIDVE